MADELVAARRPQALQLETGNYQRSVESIDLLDLAEAVKHAYGIEGLAVHAHWCHYDFDTLGSLDAPVGTSTETAIAFQYQAHPAARYVAIGVIAQSAGNYDPAMGLTVDLLEVSDPTAPVSLDEGVGLEFRTGADISRLGIDGDPPLRYVITPRTVTTAGATTIPDRLMSYTPLAPAVWFLGYPARIEVRVVGTGIRPVAIIVIEMPQDTIEGA